MGETANGNGDWGRARNDGMVKEYGGKYQDKVNRDSVAARGKYGRNRTRAC
jgi:hypothetical protein